MVFLLLLFTISKRKKCWLLGIGTESNRFTIWRMEEPLLFFASELKAILKFGIEKTIDTNSTLYLSSVKLFASTHVSMVKVGKEIDAGVIMHL